MEKIRNVFTFCQELLSVFNDKREALLLVDIPAVSRQPNFFRMTMSETEVVTKIVTKVVTDDNDVKYYKPNGWENMKSLSETPVETEVVTEIVTEIVTASVTEKKKQNKRKKKIPLHPLKKKKNKKKKKNNTHKRMRMREKSTLDAD